MFKPLFSQDLIIGKLERIKVLHKQILTDYQTEIGVDVIVAKKR